MSKRVLIASNFMISVLLIIIGLYLLEVPAPQSFMNIIQQIIGLVIVVYGAGFKLIKGN